MKTHGSTSTDISNMASTRVNYIKNLSTGGVNYLNNGQYSNISVGGGSSLFSENDKIINTLDNIVKYLDFLNDRMGVKIPSFEEFTDMSETDREIYLRDLKIDEILK